MRLLSKIVQALLATDKPLSMVDLVRATGLERKPLDRALGRLVDTDRISRDRSGEAHVYFMTRDQAEQWSPIPAPPRKVAPTGANTFGRGIGAAALSRRLRFLRELSDRPAFLGHALLAEIITDYQRALRRATEAEEAQP